MSDDILNDVFSKAITGKPLIKDRDVLRADYTPQRLLFRQEEIKAIGEGLSPLLKGAKASNLFLYGKPGTGKTAVATHVLKRLKEHVTKQHAEIALGYANTKSSREYTALVQLGSAIGLELPATGLASGDLFVKILAHINERGINTVFVLDEIDELVKNHGDKILYEMTRANSRLNKGSLSLIGISNDLNFKEFLGPRVLSSLSEEEIVFPAYTVEELCGILKDRVKAGFNENTVKEAAINLCAAMSGSERGDARRAVDLLRISGEIAERENNLKIEENHVRTALKRIERDRVNDSLTSLPIHAKLVLLSILYNSNNKSNN